MVTELLNSADMSVDTKQEISEEVLTGVHRALVGMSAQLG